jgi:nucleotide-binding universal stress UspA family protein
MTWTISKILAPVDGSECACRAARFAVELARDLGASVTLMYVFDAPSWAVAGMVAKGDLERTKEHVARGSFDAAALALGEQGRDVRHHIDIGHPAERIVAHAQAGRFDLIVMGRRGVSPMRDLLTGSVSERVSRHAHCPVTLVR